MNEEKRRPYLSDRRCGQCLKPFETTEKRSQDGWLSVIYHCPGCGNTSTVTFSPAELEEWGRRSLRSAGRSQSL